MLNHGKERQHGCANPRATIQAEKYSSEPGGQAMKSV